MDDLPQPQADLAKSMREAIERVQNKFRSKEAPEAQEL